MTTAIRRAALFCFVVAGCLVLTLASAALGLDRATFARIDTATASQLRADYGADPDGALVPPLSSAVIASAAEDGRALPAPVAPPAGDVSPTPDARAGRPSATPTPPHKTPTAAPSATTVPPTVAPTAQASPTVAPTKEPTAAPTSRPDPTQTATARPTLTPTPTATPAPPTATPTKVHCPGLFGDNPIDDIVGGITGCKTPTPTRTATPTKTPTRTSNSGPGSGSSGPDSGSN
jgi:hypothetical protein